MRRLRRNVGREAGGHDRIRIEAAVGVTVLDTECSAQRTSRQVHQIAGDVVAEIEQILLGRVALREADISQHFRRDRAGAAEHVQRYAWIGAAGQRAKRLHDALCVNVAGEGLLGLVLRPDNVEIPIPRIAEQLRGAAQSGGEIDGVDVLLVVARTSFDEAAADERQRPRTKLEAERVVGIVRRDHDRIQQIAIAGIGADEQRQRRGLVGRLTLDVRSAQAELHAVRQVLHDLAEHAQPLGRRDDVVERLEVEA